MKKSPGQRKALLFQILTKLGPGLITGASDDDPSGIGTYSQAGARFGYEFLWTMVFTFPLMWAVQEISGRIGRVTGRGLSANIRQHYPRPLLYGIVFLLFAANTVNIGADLAAMGDSMRLMVGGDPRMHTILFALVSVVLQIVIPYRRYVYLLKWLTASLFAYVITAAVIHVSWWHVLKDTLVPHLQWNKDSLAMLTAVFGTTLSPYLLFWQASQEGEEIKVHRREHALIEAPRQAERQFSRIRLDTILGMAFSNLTAFFVILTTAVVLHNGGQTQIATAEQAARALVPIAGKFASYVFAFGIIGTGLLALPVLAGSSAYAIAEALDWPTGLEKTAGRAKGFYFAILLSFLIGSCLVFLGVNPIQALVWSAILNGVIAGPVMVVMVWLGSDARVMGKFPLAGNLRWVGWLATLVMFAVTCGMILTA